MRYWIMDTDETPQRMPLQRLLRRVLEVAEITSGECEIVKARGYGLHIQALETRLDVEDIVVLPVDLLDMLSAGKDEWFYDLEARIPGSGITFGLQDST